MSRRYSDIRLEVWLKHYTLPIVWDDVVNTYSKEGMFTVVRSNPPRLERFPMCNIDRVMEQLPSDTNWVGRGDE